MINGVQTELISVRDRGLQYGDGCFETIRIIARKPILVSEHLLRLQSTCRLLRIKLDDAALSTELAEFLHNCPPDGILKIIITRGIGGRGYSAPKQLSANRILQYSPFPDDYLIKACNGVSIGISEHKLFSNSALAGIQHLNRLDQVMASYALDDSVDEALCLNQSGQVIEGTKSNLILVVGQRLVTPLLGDAGVKGIMLDYLTGRFEESGHTIQVEAVSIADVNEASELFLCNSVFGVWPVRKLCRNASVQAWTIGPYTQLAMRFNHELINRAN